MRNAVSSVLLSLLAVTLMAATCDSDPTSLEAVCDDTVGQLVALGINAARAEAGMGPLAVDLRLVQAALNHSSDMVANNFIGHEGANGSSPGDRIDAAGYDWNYYAENVAAGQATAASVVTAWMNSSGHRANILSEGSAHVGVGYVFDSDTQYGHYWTVNFGNTNAAPDLASGGCHP